LQGPLKINEWTASWTALLYKKHSELQNCVTLHNITSHPIFWDILTIIVGRNWSEEWRERNRAEFILPIVGMFLHIFGSDVTNTGVWSICTSVSGC